MATKISGNLSSDARLIVFDEVTGSIEYNELTSSGTYEITGLSENLKTIIARDINGEAYGYGSTTGATDDTPAVPTGDDFSDGIDAWTYVRSDTDASVSWNSGNETAETYINTGSSSENDHIRCVWDYQVSGNWDVQIDYDITEVGGSGSAARQAALRLYLGRDVYGPQIVVMWDGQNTNMRTYFWDGSSVQNQTYYGTKGAAGTPGLKMRVTKSGDTITSYSDPGSGSWEQINQYDISSSFRDVYMTPAFSSDRSHTARIRVEWDNFLVNVGTVHEPAIREMFTEYSQRDLNIGDTTDEFEVTNKDVNSYMSVGPGGLEFDVASNPSDSCQVISLETFDSTEDICIDVNFNCSFTTADGGIYGLALYTKEPGNRNGFNMTAHAQINGCRLYEMTDESNSYIKDDSSINFVDATWRVFYDASDGGWTFYVNGEEWHTDTHDLNGVPAYAVIVAGSWSATEIAAYTKVHKLFGTEYVNNEIPTAPYTDTYNTDIADWSFKSNNAQGNVGNSNDEYHVYSGNTGSGENYTWCNWAYFLDGDFDIEIEYRLENTGNGYRLCRLGVQSEWEGATFENGIYIDYRTGGDYGYYSNVYDGGSSQGTNNVGGATEPNKLRITRAGNLFATYYWTGSGWSQLRSATINGFDGKKAQIRLESYRYNSGSWITTAFDNFRINSGTPVDKYNGEVNTDTALTSPYSDTFDNGIDDWNFETSGANGQYSWDEPGEAIYMSITTGSSNERVTSIWDYALVGDYDVEVDLNRETYSGGGSRVLYLGALMSPLDSGVFGDDFVGITWRTDHPGGINHTFKANGTYYVNSDSGPMTWSGTFRFVRSGDVFTTYYDTGSGWVQGLSRTQSWQDTMLLYVSNNRNSTGVMTSKITEFRVNSGTILSFK